MSDFFGFDSGAPAPADVTEEGDDEEEEGDAKGETPVIFRGIVGPPRPPDPVIGGVTELATAVPTPPVAAAAARIGGVTGSGLGEEEEGEEAEGIGGFGELGGGGGGFDGNCLFGWSVEVMVRLFLFSLLFVGQFGGTGGKRCLQRPNAARSCSSPGSKGVRW